MFAEVVVKILLGDSPTRLPEFSDWCKSASFVGSWWSGHGGKGEERKAKITQEVRLLKSEVKVESIDVQQDDLSRNTCAMKRTTT